MNLAHLRSRVVAVALAGAAVVAIAGCSSGSPGARPTATTRLHQAEAPVAVTVPSGPETLPTWNRTAATATLVIPADLLFAIDSADLSPAAATVLHGIVVEIGDQSARVLVEGHADNDGTAEHNQELSERRATAVATWLATDGLDPSTITTVGWGESRPAADGATNAQNRRVVVTLTFTQTRSIR